MKVLLNLEINQTDSDLLFRSNPIWQELQDDYRTLIGVEAERNKVKSTLLVKDKNDLYYPVSALPNREYS